MTESQTLLKQRWKHFCHAYSLPIQPSFLVIGLERTGLSLCSFLNQFAGKLIATDIRDDEDINRRLNNISGPPIQIELGGHREEMITEVDCIFISPGVPLHLPILQVACQHHIPIINDIELSYFFLPGPIIGITGSNGKTTVTDLIGYLLTGLGHRHIVAGNIGSPVLDDVQSIMEEETIAVLEISSFQLESIQEFRPTVAILLNLTPDHLDRYKAVEDYYQAKWRIFRKQFSSDWAVLNYDDSWIRSHHQGIEARKFWFSTSDIVSYGIGCNGDIAVLKMDNKEKQLFSFKDVQLFGKHNRQNILAAAGAALLSGFSADSIVKHLKTYRGLPHRFEKVASFADRTFINDSKATNIGAVEAALNSHQGRLHLILGGRNKGGDFRKLHSLIIQKVKQLYLIGEAQNEIASMLDGTQKITRCESLASAIWKSYRQSEPGDSILLSPGCASFDMFQNYEERGDSFKSTVQQLIESERHCAESFSI